ncbi:hypothetical protein [Meiothermus granaticius]|uniref:Uncharacterized protein n=1 Tax=Meiothermus granaticius NBRC 107808 TaxID=1227551 RepID=A0A399F7E0_9DEIN|nr:hypothetical protein [Meiothermus granaticius]RIH91169.1 hypothetical protein Mgrana_02953 [Meiothermus granaticius NBRC 107808]GEM88369.1 hypothetical protein MGR01S_29940 [Meiothermus granaticius NBRC 107808]
MGYTHYWYVEHLKGALPQIAADLHRLRPHLPPLAGPMGEGEPEIGSQGLYFNGVGPEDCESFVLDAQRKHYDPSPDGLFAFCKTNRRPYDRAVQVSPRATCTANQVR